MLHFVTYKFSYEFVYVKNIVKSCTKSGAPRFQMPQRAARKIIYEIRVTKVSDAARAARAAQVTRPAASDGGPLRVTQARAEASDGGPPGVFLERKLCKVHAQATKAV